MTAGQRANGSIGYCRDCEKLLYQTRKAARKITNVHHGHKSTYRCPANPIFWHVGELPSPVIRGHVDRGTYFQEAS